MDISKKQTNIYFSAIALLLLCFIAGVGTFSYLTMLIIVPVFCAYVFCTNSDANFVYICVSSIVFSIVTALTAGISAVTALVSTILLLFPGVILGFSLKAKKDFNFALVFHMIYDFSLLLAVLAILRYGYNINVTAAIRDTLSETFTLNLGIIKSLYPQLVSVLEENEHQLFESIYIGLPGYVPFFASVIFVFVFMVRYALCKVFFMRYLIANDIFSGGFDTFRNTAVTNYFALAMLFLSSVSESSIFSMICLNVLFIIVILYFVGGVSVLEYRLKDKIHHPAKRLFVMMGIFVALLIFSIFLPVINFVYVFLFLGFADSLFDFRKLNTKKGDL